MSKKSDEETEKEDKETTPNAALASLKQLQSEVIAKLPPAFITALEKLAQFLTNLWPNLKVAVLSFVAGMALTIGAILIPVYNQVETLAEPVTLFETILGDLSERYVDKIDTEQLFETGMSAMLSSLDPYTEFEGKQAAADLSESMGGRYGGVGLVIAGAAPKDLALLEQETSTPTPTTTSGSPLLPPEAVEDQQRLKNDNNKDVTSNNNMFLDETEEQDASFQDRIEKRKALQKAKERGIRVVSAFEGYAFDYGMRVGDKLVQIDDYEITSATTVEDVRNNLRGEPGTQVTVAFEREGVEGVQRVTMPREIVQLRDVKLASLVGNPKDGVGYIQLTGFAADAGREVRNAILGLQQLAQEQSADGSLRGLILDLRGNPGGLLTSAVDVASLLVPKGSDIVSAKGRGFPGVLYRSRVDPIISSNTKLAVLVNDGTASAAEIVSGAVQDLDVGVIVGSDRTFGKGLVQNVEDLPFNTALKFTVAKYYTPSGRCIQGVNYQEGGAGDNGGKYKASKVEDKDRAIFHTRLGREIKDGGGIEVDLKVPSPKASALEVTLLRSGVFGDFAAQWSREHELTSKTVDIDEETYRQFQAFVNQKQKDGDIKLEALYNGALNDLKRALKASGYKGSTRELDQLQASIVREVQKDFDKYRSDIKEDLQQSILARYLPESMLIQKAIQSDAQVKAAMKLVSNGRKFDSLLAKGSSAEQSTIGGAGSLSTASAAVDDAPDSVVKLKNVKW